MSAKAAARKASKRARREQEVILGPAVAAGTSTGVRRGPPVAPSSGLLSGSLVNDEWQTVRRSWYDLHDAFPLRPHPCAPNCSGTCARNTYRALPNVGRAQVAEVFAGYRSKRVWMPFYYDGKCAEHLHSLGFENVVHRQEDFFERVLDKKFLKTVDLIWDNPPYTSAETKEKVLRALAASGLPFAMLLPISVLHVAFVRDILDMAQVEQRLGG